VNTKGNMHAAAAAELLHQGYHAQRPTRSVEGR
jgi:hypothetical protein